MLNVSGGWIGLFFGKAIIQWPKHCTLNAESLMALYFKSNMPWHAYNHSMFYVFKKDMRFKEGRLKTQKKKCAME